MSVNPDFFAAEPKPSDKTYTNEEIKDMWPQAAGELRGFANALDRGQSGLTAAQLRMAIQMAEEFYAIKMIPENDNKCVYCGCDNKEFLTKDYYIPKSKGGSNDQSNIVPVCHLCNFQKGELLPLNFILLRIFQGLGPSGAEMI